MTSYQAFPARAKHFVRAGKAWYEARRYVQPTSGAGAAVFFRATPDLMTPNRLKSCAGAFPPARLESLAYNSSLARCGGTGGGGTGWGRGGERARTELLE